MVHVHVFDIVHTCTCMDPVIYMYMYIYVLRNLFLSYSLERDVFSHGYKVNPLPQCVQILLYKDHITITLGYTCTCTCTHLPKKVCECTCMFQEMYMYIQCTCTTELGVPLTIAVAWRKPIQCTWSYPCLTALSEAGVCGNGKTDEI